MSTQEVLGAKHITDEIFLKHYNNASLDNQGVINAIAEELGLAPSGWTPISVKLRSQRLLNLLLVDRDSKTKAFSAIPDSRLNALAKQLRDAGGPTTPAGRAIVSPPKSGGSAAPVAATLAPADRSVVDRSTPSRPAGHSGTSTPAPAGKDDESFYFTASILGGPQERFQGPTRLAAVRVLFGRLAEAGGTKISISRRGAGGREENLANQADIRSGDTLYINKRPTAGGRLRTVSELFGGIDG